MAVKTKRRKRKRKDWEIRPLEEVQQVCGAEL